MYGRAVGAGVMSPRDLGRYCKSVFAIVAAGDFVTAVAVASRSAGPIRTAGSPVARPKQPQGGALAGQPT
jgi:hypothetical protein